MVKYEVPLTLCNIEILKIIAPNLNYFHFYTYEIKNYTNEGGVLSDFKFLATWILNSHSL